MGKYRLEIWNLRDMRRPEDNGRCPLHKEEENEIHVQLKCKEMQIKSNIHYIMLKKIAHKKIPIFFPWTSYCVYIHFKVVISHHQHSYLMCFIRG